MGVSQNPKNLDSTSAARGGGPRSLDRALRFLPPIAPLVTALVSLTSRLVHPAPKPDPDLAAVVGKAVHDFQPLPATGVAVATLQNGEVTYLDGFGFRDRDAKTHVDRHTAFAIGSATKAFTSMGLSMLAEDGRLAFDVPVQSYLPDFRMKDPVASAQMTLRDILSHQTGLPRHDALWYLGPFGQSPLFYRLPYLDPNPRPGFGFRQAFEYNNLTYMTAGYLAETITGQGWAEIIRTRVFEPLAMLDSHFSIRNFSHQDNRAKGYLGVRELPVKDIDSIGPAGAIHSNAVDMARWVSLHLGRGVTPSGVRIISEASLERMYQPYIAVPGAGSVNYGLGWFVGRINDQRILFHQGHTDGYSVYVSFMPEARLGVIVLSNQHGNTFPVLVAARVYSYMLKAPFEAIFTPETVTLEKSLPEALDLPRPENQAQPVARLDAYTGRYAQDGYGEVTVRRLGGDLQLSYYRESWILRQISNTDFYFDLHAYGTDFQVPVRFTTNMSGQIDAVSLILEVRVAPIRFARK